MTREALDDEALIAVEHDKQNVLVCRFDKIGHVRQRHLTQPHGPGRQRAHLPHAKPDNESAIRASLERTPNDEPIGQPQGGARGLLGETSEIGEAQAAAAIASAKATVDVLNAERATKDAEIQTAIAEASKARPMTGSLFGGFCPRLARATNSATERTLQPFVCNDSITNAIE